MKIPLTVRPYYTMPIFFWVIWAIPFAFLLEKEYFVGPIKILPLDIVFPALIIHYFYSIHRSSFTPLSKLTDVLMFALGIIMLISILRGIPDYSYQAIGEGRAMAFVWIYFVSRFYFKNEQSFCYIMILLLINSFYGSIVGYMNFFDLVHTGDYFFIPGVTKEFSKTVGSNQGLIILISTFYLALFRYKMILFKYGKIVLIPFFLTSILLSQTRTNYITLVAGLIALVLFSKNSQKNLLKITLFFTAGGILLIQNIDKDVIESIMNALFSIPNYSADANANWRILRMELEFNSVFDSDLLTFLFGYPFGRWFLANYIGFYNEGLSTHNLFVDLLTKVGFVGVTLFILILARTFYRIGLFYKKMSRIGLFSAICFSMLLVCSLSIGNLHNFSNSILIGYFLALMENDIEKTIYDSHDTP